jgi:MFS family permease
MRSLFGSLATRNFRFYLGGMLVSNIGTWMQRIAQDWLIYELTDSATALGLAITVQFGPALLFSLYGGVLADRYPKRRLLLITQSSAAAQSLILAVLTLTGHITPAAIYLLALVLGVISAIDAPVRQSFVPEIVGAGQLANAVSLASSTFHLARVIGPAIAGLLYAVIGPGWVFAINAGSYAVVVIALALMGASRARPSSTGDRVPGELRIALRYVRGRPELALCISLVFVVATFGMNFSLTMAVMVKEQFGLDASAFGFASTALAVGSLSGALAAARRRNPSPRLLLGSALGFGMSEIAVGFAPDYAAMLILLVPAGLLLLTFLLTANAIVQLSTPTAIRGRIMGLYLLAMFGGTPLGTPVISWISSWNPRYGLWLGGGVVLVATGTVALLVVRDKPLALPPQWRLSSTLPSRTGTLSG